MGSLLSLVANTGLDLVLKPHKNSYVIRWNSDDLSIARVRYGIVATLIATTITTATTMRKIIHYLHGASVVTTKMNGKCRKISTRDHLNGDCAGFIQLIKF